MQNLNTFYVFDKKTKRKAVPEIIVANEPWAKGISQFDIEGFAMLEDGNLILADECGNFVYCPQDRFTVIWDTPAATL
jgi:hypothetical protein